MKNLNIKNSYNVWSPKKMKEKMKDVSLEEYNSSKPNVLLDRKYPLMYAEWMLHNVGYYATKPFCKVEAINKINKRCKDVDLEEKHKKEKKK